MYGMNPDQFAEGGFGGTPMVENPMSLRKPLNMGMTKPFGFGGLLSGGNPFASQMFMPAMGQGGFAPHLAMPSLGGQPFGQDNDILSQAALVQRLFGGANMGGGSMGGGSVGGTSNMGSPAVQQPGPGQSAMAMRAAQDVASNAQPVSSNMPDASQGMVNLFNQGGGGEQFRKPLRQRGRPFNFLGSRGYQF